MKYSLILACAGLVASQTTRTTDTAAYTSVSTVLTNVASSVSALEAQVTVYDGSSAAFSNVGASAQAVLQEINSGDQEIQGLGDIDQGSAPGLLAPLNALISSVSAVVDAITSRHNEFITGCVAPSVSSNLVAQSNAAAALGSDIVDRIPTVFQGIASASAAAITSYLSVAVGVYTTDSTLPAACSPSTTPSSTTSSISITDSTSTTTSTDSTSTITTTDSTSTFSTSSSVDVSSITASPAPGCPATTSANTIATTAYSAAVASVSMILVAVGDDLSSLNNAVLAYKDPCEADGVRQANAYLLDELATTSPQLCEFPTIQADDFTGPLLGPVLNLAGGTNETISNIVAEKDLFVAACAGPEVLGNLQDQLNAVNEFAGRLVSLADPNIAPIATQISTSITDFIKTGIYYYQTETTTPDDCVSTCSTTSDGSYPTSTIYTTTYTTVCSNGDTSTSTETVTKPCPTGCGSESGSPGSGGGGGGGGGGSGSTDTGPGSGATDSGSAAPTQTGSSGSSGTDSSGSSGSDSSGSDSSGDATTDSGSAPTDSGSSGSSETSDAVASASGASETTTGPIVSNGGATIFVTGSAVAFSVFVALLLL